MKNKRLYYFSLLGLTVIFIILSLLVNLGKLDYLDELIFNFVISFKCGFLSSFLYVITKLASAKASVLLLLVFVIFFMFKKYYFSVKYLIINMAGGTLIVNVLKNVFKRVRPVWKWIKQGGFSYPSGHTMAAFLLYGTLILIISKKVNNGFKKPLIGLCTLMIVLTGLSRIYFGAHFFSDVLASLILGLIILLISNIFMSKEVKNNDKNKTRKTV